MKTYQHHVSLACGFETKAKRNSFPPLSFIAKVFVIILAIGNCWFAPYSSKANQVFGSLPSGNGGYGISTEGGNTFGVAVQFTTQQAVDFSSVTLWVSGYTGLDGSSLQLSLLQDTSSMGYSCSGPGNIISTATTAANSGADAAFNFSLSGQLQADTTYWLFLYLEVPGGGIGSDYGRFNCSWDRGGSSTGNITVNGSEDFADGFDSSSFDSDSPAFAFSAVPDLVSTGSAMAVSLGCLALYRFRLRQP